MTGLIFSKTPVFAKVRFRAMLGQKEWSLSLSLFGFRTEFDGRNPRFWCSIESMLEFDRIVAMEEEASTLEAIKIQ